MEGGLLGRMRKGAAAMSEIDDASSVRQEKQTRNKMKQTHSLGNGLKIGKCKIPCLMIFFF